MRVSKQLSYYHRRVARARAAGLCPYCWGRFCLGECIATQRRQRYWRLKNDDRCTKCGEDSDNGSVCLACYEVIRVKRSK